MTLDTDIGLTDDLMPWLLCRVADLYCAIPGACVIEVMRVLAIDPLAGMPSFVSGLSIIRGAPVPVVDAGILLNAANSRAAYFVIIAVAGRPLALAVDQIVGLRGIAEDAFEMLPPLLKHVANEVVAGIRARDGELLLLLDTARLVPADLLAELNATGARR